MNKIWQRIKLESVFYYYLLKVYLYILRYYFKFYLIKRKQHRAVKQHLELRTRLERIWYSVSLMDAKNKKSIEKELRLIDRKTKKEEKEIAELDDTITYQQEYFFVAVRRLLKKMKNLRLKFIAKINK